MRGMQEIYQAPNQHKLGNTENLTSPQMDGIHSNKPITEELSSPIYNLFQLHK